MSYYIGLDLHRKFSQVCVLDEAGDQVIQQRIYHDDEKEMTDFFAQFPAGTPAVVEATLGWMWMADLMDRYGIEVHLAHSLGVRLIAESRLKTDKVDAWSLAQLLRTGFLPESYLAPEHVRDKRMLLRHREAMKKNRTVIKNRVHSLLYRYNIILKQSDIFGKAGMEMLSRLNLDSHARHILDDLLDYIEYSNKQMKRLESYLRNNLEPDLRIKWLKSLPGIGTLSAYYLVAEIGDIGRFSTPGKLVSYIGLCPSTRSSGDRTRHGPPRGGRRLLKWVLVEAAHTAVKKDSYFAKVFHRMERKKGKQAAYVVVAHKMAKVIWHMLTEGRAYKVQRKQPWAGSTGAMAVR